jgi:seryl-tRNA synthetase
MAIPKKPTASPATVEEFISGAKTEAQVQGSQTEPAPVQHAGSAVTLVKVRRKPVRQKEIVTRCTFILNLGTAEKLDAYAFWQRMTKKAVLEQALTKFFGDKKVRPIPRQEHEPEQV